MMPDAVKAAVSTTKLTIIIVCRECGILSSVGDCVGMSCGLFLLIGLNVLLCFIFLLVLLASHTAGIFVCRSHDFSVLYGCTNITASAVSSRYNISNVSL